MTSADSRFWGDQGRIGVISAGSQAGAVVFASPENAPDWWFVGVASGSRSGMVDDLYIHGDNNFLRLMDDEWAVSWFPTGEFEAQRERELFGWRPLVGGFGWLASYGTEPSAPDDESPLGAAQLLDYSPEEFTERLHGGVLELDTFELRGSLLTARGYRDEPHEGQAGRFRFHLEVRDVVEWHVDGDTDLGELTISECVATNDGFDIVSTSAARIRVRASSAVVQLFVGRVPYAVKRGRRWKSATRPG